MKILLLGEYSNLHSTLAKGLRELGHKVTVASDGDGFKDYPRDIDLLRKSSSVKDTFSLIYKVFNNLKNFKGYDVVQLINPCFTTLNVKFNARLYRFIRKHNKKVFLGAFGDDAYWLEACLDNKTFRYSEFFVDGKPTSIDYNEKIKLAWGVGSDRSMLNQNIVSTCDGIIACLYEYYTAYKEEFADKLAYIPLPINLSDINYQIFPLENRLRFFIGINKDRSEFKGTDRLLSALLKLKKDYDSKVDVKIAESVPYAEYIQLMSESDIVLDQLYSYSPAMNALLAMSMGKVLVGGGEPEMYELLSEYENKPIINVIPSDDDIYNKLEGLLKNNGSIPETSKNSRLFVEEHHDHMKVAQQYLDFWNK